MAKNCISKLFCSVVLTISFLSAANSQTFTLNSISGDDIVAGSFVGTDEYKEEYQKCLYKTSIILEAKPMIGNYNLTGVYTVKITFDISYTDNNKMLQNVDDQRLEIEFSNEVNRKYKNIDFINFEGGYDVNVNITSVEFNYDSSPLSQAIPDFVFLSIQNERDRYIYFNNSLMPSESIDLSLNGDNIEVNILEDLPESAEGFEIEYTWADFDHKNGTSIYNFQNNATFIRLVGSSFSIPNLFRKGYIVVRYRYYGRIGCDSYDYSVWTHSDGNFAITSNESHIILVDDHQPNLNWTNGINFTEGMRKKTGISYYDGLFRARQNVTKLESQGHIVVQEDKYDHAGRKAVSLMPSPIFQESKSPVSYINFYKDINLNPGNGSAFSNTSFEKLGTNQQIDAMPISDYDGPASYFSPSNSSGGVSGQYLPDSEGYPFAHTVFTQDGRGKVRYQGNVGKQFQIGASSAVNNANADNKGRIQKYFYGIPAQDELDALFGNNVGYAAYYDKTLMLDENGQGSISITNNKGQVIATALTGEAPAPLVPLDEQPSMAEYFNINFLQGQDISHHDKEKLSYSGILLLTSASHITLDYEIQETTVDPDCYVGTEPIVCGYDVDIKVSDICNDVVYTGPVIQNVTDYSLHLTQLTTNPLDIGEYTVGKTLTLNPIQFKQNESLFLNNLDQNDPDCVYNQLNKFRELLLATSIGGCIDSLCFVTHCMNTIEIASFGGDLEAYKKALLECVLTDPEYIACAGNTQIDFWDVAEKLMDDMLDDFSPGGQYATYYMQDDDDPENPAGTIPQDLSLLPCTSYFNPQFAISGVNIYTISNDNSITPLKFVETFDRTWLTEDNPPLISKHPEYGYYLYLKSFMDAAWDEKFMDATTFDEAYNAGVLKPIAGINGYFLPAQPPGVGYMADPYFETHSHLPLIQYKPLEEGILATKYSIWDIAFISALASMVDVKKVYEYPANSGEFVLPAPGQMDAFCAEFELPCENCFKDKYWLILKGLYGSLKNELKYNQSQINAFLSANNYTGNCPGVNCLYATNCPGWATAEPRFNNLTPLPLSNMDEEVEVNNQLDEHCEETCDSYKDDWRTTIQKCVEETAGPMDESQLIRLNQLINNMTAICLSGCGAGNPAGTSSNPNGNSESTFQFEINDFFKDIEFVQTPTCHELIIDYPPPHTYDLAGGEQPFIDECICSKFDLYFDRLSPEGDMEIFHQKLVELYNYPYDINTLKELECACNVMGQDYGIKDDPNTPYKEQVVGLHNLTFPFTCQECVDCSQISVLYQQALTTYTSKFNLPPTPVTFETAECKNFVTLELNNILGFSLSLNEYYDFMAYCGIDYINQTLEATRKTPSYIRSSALISIYDGQKNLEEKPSSRLTTVLDVTVKLVEGVGSNATPGGEVAYKLNFINNTAASKQGRYKHKLPKGWKFSELPTSYLNRSIDTNAVGSDILIIDSLIIPPGTSSVLDFKVSLDSLIFLTNYYYTQSSFKVQSFDTIYSDWKPETPNTYEPTPVYIITSDPCDEPAPSMTEMKNFLNQLISVYNGQSGFYIDPRSLTTFAGTSLDQWYPQFPFLKLTITNVSKGVELVISDVCTESNLCLLNILSIGDLSDIQSVKAVDLPDPSPGNVALSVIAELDVILNSGIETTLFLTGACYNFVPCEKRLLCNRAISLESPEVTEPCITNLLDLLANTVQYNAREFNKALLDKFRNTYIEQCLDHPETEFNAGYYTKEYHYTLYYYDQAGNLLATVPPKGVHKLGATEIANVKLHRDNPMTYTDFIEVPHTFTTVYNYDVHHQIFHNMSPDMDKSGTEVKFVTHIRDENGRLILSQDPRQKAADLSTYYLYDNFNRIIESGEVHLTDPNGNYNPINGISYTDYVMKLCNPSLFSLDRKNVTRNVYDENFTNTGLNLNIDDLFAEPRPYLRKRISSVLFYENYLVSGLTCEDQAIQDVAFSAGQHFDYDVHGNVKTLIQHYPDRAAILQDIKRIEYEYDLVSNNLRKLIYQRGERDQFIHVYEYDEDNRIHSVSTSTDGIIWDNDADYDYYQHGPLSRTEIGENKVQGMDYIYTLQGWIKGINSNVLQTDNDPGHDAALKAGLPSLIHSYFAEDAFAYSLGYFKGDYNPIGAAAIGALPFAQTQNNITEGSNTAELPGMYNGNISYMVNSIKKTDQNNLSIQPFIFKYDQLHRIRDMKSLDPINSATNQWQGSVNPGLTNTYTYDPNGNIKTASRKDAGGNLIDDLAYGYQLTDNKLNGITEGIGSNAYSGDLEGTQSYTYDASGNLITDGAEEISSIIWDHRGKILEINRQSNSTKPNLVFHYDAAGHRIEKTVIEGTATTRYFYVRDPQGNVLAVYKQLPTGQVNLLEHHIYGSGRLGIRISDLDANLSVPPTPIQSLLIPGKRTAGIRHYELTNHLGNVSVIVSDKKLLSANQSQKLYLPEVISYQDYYPFGMVMTDRSGSLPNAAYRYGYNGKENDNEVKGEANQQDYGFRVYDPRVGRFLSVDPLTNDYPMLTPYQFASNTPIESIDMDGAEYFSSKEAVFNITNGDIEVKQPVMEEIDPSWNNGNPYIFKVGNKKYLGFNNIFGSFNLSKSIFKLKEYLHFDGGYTYDVSTNPFRDWQLSQQNRPSNSYRIKNNGGLDRRYTAWGTRVNNTSTPSAIRSIAGPMAAYIVFDLFYNRYKSSIASNINENMMEQIYTIQKSVLVDVMMAASLNMIPKKYQTETFYSSIANILYSGENTSGNKDLEQIALKIGYNISYPPLAERALIISDNLMIGESDPMFKKLWNMNSKMTLKWKEQ